MSQLKKTHTCLPIFVLNHFNLKLTECTELHQVIWGIHKHSSPCCNEGKKNKAQSTSLQKCLLLNSCFLNIKQSAIVNIWWLVCGSVCESLIVAADINGNWHTVDIFCNLYCCTFKIILCCSRRNCGFDTQLTSE